MAEFTRKELAESAFDEIQKRQDNYPRWVREGKMKQAVASLRIEKMQAIYRVIINAPDSAFKQE